MALFPFYILKFGIIAELLEGAFAPRQLCHLISLLRLRSVTLRPVFSGGLPFSSCQNYVLFHRSSQEVL